MSEKIYVIGHKSPDTDTVVSAIAAADFLNQREGTNVYIPAITGPLNSETEFVLQHFMVEPPMLLEDANGASIVLVDHNEAEQTVDGAKNIVAIIDHHKINFTGSDPIEVIVKPWGSTATVILDLYAKAGLEVPVHLPGLLLCAILSDTVILRSPTTTARDIAMVEAIAQNLDLNYKDLGMQLFSAKAQITTKSALEIIQNDFKEFEVEGKKVAIGQIETPSLKEVEGKIADIKEEFTTLKTAYHTLMLILTDIIEGGSKIVILSDTETELVAAFNTTAQDHVTEFIPGMMSRKKQVVPVITKVLSQA